MAAPAATPLIRSNSATKFTKKQVYMVLKNFVYPPCAKHPDNIRMFHSLEFDLGYVGSSRQNLAGKTNGSFGLTGTTQFSGSDMMSIDTVLTHFKAVVAILTKQGRLGIQV